MVQGRIQQSSSVCEGCQIPLPGISGELTENTGLCLELGIPGLGEIVCKHC